MKTSVVLAAALTAMNTANAAVIPFLMVNYLSIMMLIQDGHLVLINNLLNLVLHQLQLHLEVEVQLPRYHS